MIGLEDGMMTSTLREMLLLSPCGKERYLDKENAVNKPKILASVVRELRESAGLTQRELENKLRANMIDLFGVRYKEYYDKKKFKPGTYVSKIETWTTLKPGWKRIVALADALGVERDHLLALAGIRETADTLLKKYYATPQPKMEESPAYAVCSEPPPETERIVPEVLIINASLLPPTLVKDLSIFAKSRGISAATAVRVLMELALSLFVT